MTLSEFIGMKLKKARIESNYTQEKICEIVGVKQGTLSKIEAGHRKNINILLLAQLAKFYKKPFTYFIPKTLWEQKYFISRYNKQ